RPPTSRADDPRPAPTMPPRCRITETHDSSSLYSKPITFFMGSAPASGALLGAHADEFVARGEIVLEQGAVRRGRRTVRPRAGALPIPFAGAEDVPLAAATTCCVHSRLINQLKLGQHHHRPQQIFHAFFLQGRTHHFLRP